MSVRPLIDRLETHLAMRYLEQNWLEVSTKKSKTIIEDLYPDVVAAADGSGMPIIFEVFCIYIDSGLRTDEFAFGLPTKPESPWYYFRVTVTP
jgi:hypothetical protein